MTKIHSLLSDLSLNEELSIGLKKRSIDQMFIYMDKGAEVYYKSVASLRSKTPTLYTARDFYRNFIKEQFDKKQKIAFISLGCGDARQEKGVLEQLSKGNYNFEYFAVDSSREMLTLADKNIKDIDCKKHFICADITSKNFREEIMKITKDFDKRILGFLGCTFVNYNQTEITDSLYNMIEKEDLLWFDVFAKPENTQKDDFNIFKRYEHTLQDPAMLDFFFYSLKTLGVNLEDGELKMKTRKEESVGALIFHFYFKLKKDLNIIYRTELIHLRKTQEIGLLNVRAYSPEILIDFFKGNDFDVIKNEVEKQDGPLHKGQFLAKHKT